MYDASRVLRLHWRSCGFLFFWFVMGVVRVGIFERWCSHGVMVVVGLGGPVLTLSFRRALSMPRRILACLLIFRFGFHLLLPHLPVTAFSLIAALASSRKGGRI